jgi:hypothetical protein
MKLFITNELDKDFFINFFKFIKLYRNELETFVETFVETFIETLEEHS